MISIIFATGLTCILGVLVMLVLKPADHGSRIAQLRIIGSARGISDESTGTQWRSVRIRPGLITCERAASLTDQVFLSKDVPQLPLADCSERDCRCHYVFLDDRRSGIDRRDELGRLGEFLSSAERDRRRSTGRRMGDLAPA